MHSTTYSSRLTSSKVTYVYKLHVDCRRTNLIKWSNFIWISVSCSQRALQGLLCSIWITWTIWSRRVTTAAILNSTLITDSSKRKFVMQSSIFSMMKIMSRIWVTSRNVNEYIEKKVNRLYNIFERFEDHSIGRHTPPMLYSKKFKASIRIFTITIF